MDVGKRKNDQASQHFSSETGQSIVLIALIFLALLAFVGLAVDAGFAFARSSQFSRAVDSAALAGVVDLLNTIDTDIDVNGTPTTITLCTGIDCANLRAQQYLSANGWPTPTLTSFVSGSSYTRQGIPEYTITVTWPVDFFFATLIGLDDFPITHHASAAFAAQSDILVPTQGDYGQIRAASQYIVGDTGCTHLGDPVSPQQATAGSTNEEYILYEGLYRYRIRIPETYTATESIHIELFDPDTVNNNTGNSFTVSHSISDGRPDYTANCSTGSGQSCFVWTGEDIKASFKNPYWFQRVDENFDTACNSQANNPVSNTTTTFELYYIDSGGERRDIASYLNDNSNPGSTDLQWITPSGFDVYINDVDGMGSAIPVVNRVRYIYLDVSASGSAKNVWDIRAGPDPNFYVNTLGLAALASDANARNLQIANTPAGYNTFGINVLALGRMPTQYFLDVGSDASEYVQRLVQLPIALGEGAIYTTIFDFDTPNAPYTPGSWNNNDQVVNFKIDSLSPGIFNIFALAHSPNPDPLNWESECAGTLDCNGRWFRPQYAMGISSKAFAGGTLTADFDPNRDGLVWSVYVTSGRPFLTR